MGEGSERTKGMMYILIRDVAKRVSVVNAAGPGHNESDRCGVLMKQFFAFLPPGV